MIKNVRINSFLWVCFPINWFLPAYWSPWFLCSLADSRQLSFLLHFDSIPNMCDPSWNLLVSPPGWGSLCWCYRGCASISISCLFWRLRWWTFDCLSLLWLGLRLPLDSYWPAFSYWLSGIYKLIKVYRKIDLFIFWIGFSLVASMNINLTDVRKLMVMDRIFYHTKDCGEIRKVCYIFYIKIHQNLDLTPSIDFSPPFYKILTLFKDKFIKKLKKYSSLISKIFSSNHFFEHTSFLVVYQASFSSAMSALSSLYTRKALSMCPQLRS